MAKKKEKKEKLDTVVKVAEAWLSKESNLFMKNVAVHTELSKAKGKKNTKRINELESEICRLVDEYIADAKRTIGKRLEMTDDEYQMRLRNLETLKERLGADACDDMDPIVADMKEVKAKIAAQIEAEILKGPVHVERCRIVVAHEEMLDKIRLRIADRTVAKNNAQINVKEIGEEIKKLAASLQKRIDEGPVFSPGTLFDHADKEKQKKKQIEAVMAECPECNGFGMDKGIECESCDGTGKVKPKKYIFNEQDVFTDPDEIELRFVKKLKCKVKLRHAQAPDGDWYYGYDVTVGTKHAGMPVCHGPGSGYETKEEAIQEAAGEVVIWVKGTKPAGLKAIIKAIDEQVKTPPEADELHVFTNETDWIIAKDKDDMAVIASTEMGYDGDFIDDFNILNGDTELVFTPEDGEPITKTAEQWCKERGRGLLMSIDT